MVCGALEGGGRIVNKVDLTIIGMNCDHCKTAVEKALQSVPGVTNVMVDRINGRASLDLDGTQATKNDLIKKVEGAGFSAL